MRNKAINALIEMGMPADIKGFYYIVEAICLFEEDRFLNIPTTKLYEQLAQRNETTAARAERAIRHAFSNVLTKGVSETVEKYLTRQNPTSGNLLHVLYLRLTQED